MLTADSELGLARSLVTRQYLDSVGDRMLVENDRAGRAREWAAVSASGATARRDAAVARTSPSPVRAWRRPTAEVQAKQASATGHAARYRMLMRMTKVDRSEDYGRLKTCGDWLTRLLSRSGFEGEDLREAWAIVMRESGGREDAISRTDDLGLFQINTATWREQPWFDRELLLTRKYNAQVAHTLSRGGSTWYSWGLDGHGRPDARAYVKSGWSEERIVGSIVMPYVQWYAQYPCRPAYEKDLGLGAAGTTAGRRGQGRAGVAGGGRRASGRGRGSRCRRQHRSPADRRTPHRYRASRDRSASRCWRMWSFTSGRDVQREPACVGDVVCCGDRHLLVNDRHVAEVPMRMPRSNDHGVREEQQRRQVGRVQEQPELLLRLSRGGRSQVSGRPPRRVRRRFPSRPC